MPYMLVTWLVFQLPTAWLNNDAPWNMLLMIVTLLVSQLPTAWLNNHAPLNMPFMLVTWLVSHMEMSSLKFLPKNNEFILVMPDVHQLPMGYPYVAPIAHDELVLQP